MIDKRRDTIGRTAIGCWMILGWLAASCWAAEEPTFFPNLTRVYVPRGTSQLLKPYLPEIAGQTADYRLAVEMPHYLAFVAVEPSMGDPPQRVRSEPGTTRDGVAYVSQVLEYDTYPMKGFELSICWLDAQGGTINYQPAIARGGTHDWRHVQGTVTAPPGARQARLLIIKWQNRGISGTFWVDNVVFRQAKQQENLLTTGTFDEPEWKSHLVKPEGKDGSRCAKFVCPPEMAERQQALWMDPVRKPLAVDPQSQYVVELDLRVEGLGAKGVSHIASLLFRAAPDAPEGPSHIYTSVSSGKAAPVQARSTELIILPPLKNVRPKQVRIAPCHYAMDFTEPQVAQSYADNAWQSGITWTYGSVHNNVVAILSPRGHRVWLSKPGHPFEAHGKARDLLSKQPELQAVGFDGKPLDGMFCPTWLLSPKGAPARRILEDDLVELVDRDSYTAVNWDIEQAVCSPAEGGKSTRGFCLCARCLDAFRKQQGLAQGEPLDGPSVAAKHKDAWVTFRCQQNAELVGHVHDALKRCARPIEFSVYSGYQCQATREMYGADWALLAPHLDLAIAGYGGARKDIQATREALGKVPFIGGHNYYLTPTPMQASAGWMQSSLGAVPNPLPWRNRLLSQFINGGCQGVLVWYLPTMDGGTFYYTSEAAEIIATYEDLFRNGKRCDESLRVSGLKPDYWAAFEHRGQRLLVLMNQTAKDVTFQVQQPSLQGEWDVRVHGQSRPAALDPSKFTLPLEPWGARVVVFSQR